MGSLTKDQSPRRNEYGKPVLTCRWCGREMDYADIYFLGPQCSVACNAAWGFYGWISLAIIFTAVLFVPGVMWFLLPGDPIPTPIQSAFGWVVIVFPALVGWYCSILGYRVRKQNARPKSIPLEKYDPRMRA